MRRELLKFLSIQRQIFGVCPCCSEIFRVSDGTVYLKKKPSPDWHDKLKNSERRIEMQGERIDDEEESLRKIAREKGRLEANRSVKKIDNVFTPNKYNPKDAKVMFHPIDYLIFNGMEDRNEIKNLVLFDRVVREKPQKDLQKSIEKVITKENYEWVTMQVNEEGNVEYK